MPGITQHSLNIPTLTRGFPTPSVCLQCSQHSPASFTVSWLPSLSFRAPGKSRFSKSSQSAEQNPVKTPAQPEPSFPSAKPYLTRPFSTVCDLHTQHSLMTTARRITTQSAIHSTHQATLARRHSLRGTEERLRPTAARPEEAQAGAFVPSVVCGFIKSRGNPNQPGPKRCPSGVWWPGNNLWSKTTFAPCCSHPRIVHVGFITVK